MLKKMLINAVILCSVGTSYALPNGIGIVSDDVATAIMCEENISISDHMRRMGAIIRELTGAVQATFNSESQELNKEAVIENAQMLRIHLGTVFNLTPPKILAIDAEDPQGSKLVFQGYLLRMMQLTISLEKELLKVPTNEQEAELQQIHVEAFINEIYQTVEQAHDLFRH
jgi:hypothetical protein